MKNKLASLAYIAAGTVLPLLSLPPLAYPQAYAYPGYVPPTPESPYGAPGIPWKMRILSLLMGAAFGGLVGAFFSDKARKFRLWVVLAILGLMVLGGIVLSDTTAFLSGAVVSAATVWWLWRLPRQDAGYGFLPIWGDARPATRDEIAAAGYVAAHNPSTNTFTPARPGIPLGTFIPRN